MHIYLARTMIAGSWSSGALDTRRLSFASPRCLNTFHHVYPCSRHLYPQRAQEFVSVCLRACLYGLVTKSALIQRPPEDSVKWRHLGQKTILGHNRCLSNELRAPLSAPCLQSRTVTDSHNPSTFGPHYKCPVGMDPLTLRDKETTFAHAERVVYQQEYIFPALYSKCFQSL